jgi:hypothetical protein
MLLTLLSTFLACGGDASVTISPDFHDWGEVDFHSDECMDCSCTDGCDSQDIWITNSGERFLQLKLPNGFDHDHLCIDGATSEPHMILGDLEPSEQILLRVSVCGYLPGELNIEGDEEPTPVEGSMRITDTDGLINTSFDWSFVPVRVQD